MVCVLRIRSLGISELDRVREIERDASRSFGEFGMRQIAEDPPLSFASQRP